MNQKIGPELLEDGAAAGNLPATTKGDVLAHDGTTLQRLAVGTDGQLLQADSAQSAGVKWADPGASGAIPVGAVMDWGGAVGSPPIGWLVCDGSAVSRTTYAALFSAIGTTHGVGDGSTTFNLPSTAGRVTVGAGSGTVVRGISGVNTSTDEITLDAAQEEFQTGQALVYTSSGTEITGLTSGNTYYAIRVSSTVVKLASTRASAVAGTAIDLTGAGSGTQQLTLNFASRTAGETFGEERHSLLVAELPGHSHTNGASFTGSNSGTGPGGFTSASTGLAGGSGDHENMPPAVVMPRIIFTSVGV